MTRGLRRCCLCALLVAAPSSGRAAPPASAPAARPVKAGPGAEAPRRALRPAALGVQRHLVELGVFAGGCFLARDHELYDLHVGQKPFVAAAPSFGARVSYLPWPFVALEVEGGVVPTHTTDGEPALVYGLRAHLVALYPARIAPFLLLGGGLLGVASSGAAVGSDVDGSYHLGWGIKWYARPWLAVRLDGRYHLSGELGPHGRSSTYELLAGVATIIGWSKETPPPPPELAPPPPDSDGDGLSDLHDKCPHRYAKTPDGCPIKDSDGDGLPDGVDACPTKYAKTPDGCPIKDADGDGLLDDNDRCPKQYAETPDGCPDRDGDGYPDDRDGCPDKPETFNGYRDEDGCPDSIPRLVKRFTGVIRGIHFASDKAEIRRNSVALLRRAVRVFERYPEIKITIRGHTDSRGSEAHNLDLSLRRALSVKRFLVEHGVAADRIGVEGVGYREPIASNHTRRGRARNRRVEFKLGQPKPEALEPVALPESAPASQSSVRPVRSAPPGATR